MTFRATLSALVCGLVLAAGSAAAVASAQADRFETKIPFKFDQSNPLAVQLGPVKITNLKITNLGRGYGRGGFGPRRLESSEMETTLRLAFDVSNPGEDWEITYTIEFLDKDGKPIDKLVKKEGYEETSRVANLDHAILSYVVPMITDVKISLYGRLD